MIASTKGIVLRNTKYTDNKSIVTILTENFGKTSYMVYGLHSKRSLLRYNAMQVLSILDLQVEHRDGKPLQRVKEAVPCHSLHGLYGDPAKMAFGFFIAEVVDKSIYDVERDKAVFDYVYKCVDALDKADGLHGLAPVDFLLGFSRRLGFFPDDGRSNEFLRAYPDKAASAMFFDLLEGRRVFDRPGRRLLLELAVNYFRYNLPSMSTLSSVKVLQSFFDDNS